MNYIATFQQVRSLARRRSTFVWGAIVALLATFLTPAPAAVINFAPLSQPGGSYNNVGGVLVQDGFQFTSSLSTLAAWQDSSPNHPVGGVAATSLTDFFAGSQTTMTQVGGAPFDLLGIDLAGYSTAGSGPFNVTFTGTKSDSSIVQQTFTPQNANGFQPVLQPFSFNSNFTDLVSVNFTQGFNGSNAYQFNNLVANTAQVGPPLETIRLRSGFNEAGGVPLTPGAADANITAIHADSATVPLRNSSFTVADFQDAQSGAVVYTVAPISTWLPGSSGAISDAQARWINFSTTPGSVFGEPSRSVLYAIPFDVQTQNISTATLTFEWAVDDALGDWYDIENGIGWPTPGGNHPNLPGVYIGQAGTLGQATTPMIFAGNFQTAPYLANRTITDLIQPGQNFLYVYQRDLGAGVSGVIFSATIRITPVPEPSTVTLLILGALPLVGVAARQLRRQFH